MSNEMIFWGGAVAMLVVAMAMLLPPLLGRTREVGTVRRETNLAIFEQRMEELKEDLQQGILSEDQFAQAEADLKRELLSDLEGEEQQVSEDQGAGRMAAIAVLMIVPAIALGVYFKIGSPHAIDVVAASQSAEAEQSRIAFEQAVAKLEQKQATDPLNSEGWLMLAKSYRYLGRDGQIVGLFERALSHYGDRPDPQILLEYGEALADQQQGSWSGKPLAQLTRALEIDPLHADTLWFTGHIHFEMGKFQEALGFWERLAKVIPAEDAEVVGMLNQMAAKAQQKLGLAVTPLLEAKAVSGTVLTVSVFLDPALSQQVIPEDTVFVYAKAAGRPGAPLAAQRLTVADLPVTLKLDDSMAMVPGNDLSSAEQVIVGAKITKSGVATGGVGDLIGSVETSTKVRDPITIVINQEQQ